MRIVTRFRIGLAIPFKRDAHNYCRIALEHGLYRQVECHDRVAAQIAGVFKDMSVFTGQHILFTIPLKGFTGQHRCIARQNGLNRQVERHNRVTTQVAGILEDMGIVASFGIGFAIPLKRSASNHRGITWDDRQHGKVKYHRGVAIQITAILDYMGRIARYWIGVAVPLERFASDHRGITWNDR